MTAREGEAREERDRKEKSKRMKEDHKMHPYSDTKAIICRGNVWIKMKLSLILSAIIINLKKKKG